MPPNLNNFGVVSYNGYTFGPETVTKVHGRPVPSEDSRTVKVVEWTLDVTGYITSVVPATTDAEILAIRHTMLKSGGELHYNGPGRGFGGVDVNDGRGVWDSAWGPHPLYFEYSAVGAQFAGLCRFGIRWQQPECSDSVFRGRPMSVVWDVSFDVTPDGLTRQTVAGFVEVPITRNGIDNRIPPDQCDRYRESFAYPPNPGFRRVANTWKDSSDRRKLTFTIVDEELVAAPPDGAVKFEVSQSVDGDLSTGFRMWPVTLQAAVTVPKQYPKSKALDCFKIVMKDRLSKTRKRWLPLRLNLTESSIFESLISTFSFTYKLLGTKLRDVVGQSGLWTQVAGTNGNSWAASMALNFGPRGVSGLVFNGQADAIVDLCGSGNTGLATQGSAATLTSVAPSDPTDSFPTTSFDPSETYLTYDLRVKFESNAHIARHRPLGSRPTPNPGPSFPADSTDVNATAGAVGAFQTDLPGGAPDLLQFVGSSPEVRVVLYGTCSRMGLAPTKPSLVSVGGVPTVLSKETWDQCTISLAGGVAIVKADFEFVYLLVSPPSGPLPIPAAPAIQAGAPSPTNPGPGIPFQTE